MELIRNKKILFGSILIIGMLLIIYCIIKNDQTLKRAPATANTPTGAPPEARTTSKQIGSGHISMTIRPLKTGQDHALKIDSDDIFRDRICTILTDKQTVLNLTASETAMLLDIYMSYHDVMLNIEAQLINETSFYGDKLILSIPIYPEAGQVFQDSMEADIKSMLGADILNRLNKNISMDIARVFNYFGTCRQTFLIKENNGYYDILSEIHSYENYEPELEKNGRFVSSTSSARISLSEMNGEMRKLRPFVEKLKKGTASDIGDK